MLHRIILLLWLILISLINFGQATNVEFRVNMNYQISLGKFNPASESVDVAGTFNGWGTPTTILSDADSDGIYTATVSLNIGTTIEFKGRINAAWNGREEFPGGGPNRSYLVKANGIAEFWYSDEFPPDVLVIQSINSSAVLLEPGHSAEFSAAVAGNPSIWEWSFPGGNPSSSSSQTPAVIYDNEGSYDVTLTITNSNSETVTKTFTSYIKVGSSHSSWWNDAVYYELFVRSFYDSNDDGIGDFNGLTQKLDYLNDGDPNTTTDLGITALWLMPVCESPSYHGYDVTNYKKINPKYGTQQDFLTFIDEAHKRGIKVITDFVINHTSDQHPWFVNSKSSTSNPYRNFYRWSVTNPGYNGPWGEQVWYQNSTDNQYYYALFWGGMPDLNYNEPAVKDSIFDAARFWLTTMKTDGFRLDAAKYIFEDGTTLENTLSTFNFWADFHNFYKGVNANAMTVGEVWDNTSTILNYVNGKLDFCFEFDLAGSILNAVNNGISGSLMSKIQQVYDSYQPLQFGTFLTNHDQNRTIDVLGNEVNKNKTAAAIYLTLPGIPFVYYGEELGISGSGVDENKRTPMQWNTSANAGFSSALPWRSVNSNYATNNVTSEQNDPSSLLNFYKKLINTRNNEIALRRGTYKRITCSNNAIVSFIRQQEDQTIAIVVNLSNSDQTNVNLSLSEASISKGTKKVTDLLSNTAANDIIIDNNGSFSNWIPLNTIKANSAYLFKIGALTNIKSSAIEKVDIYPNPVMLGNNITIKLPQSFQHTQSVLQMTDLSGKILLQRTMNSNEFILDAANISSRGCYLLQIVNQNNRLSKLIIIK